MVLVEAVLKSTKVDSDPAETVALDSAAGRDEGRNRGPFTGVKHNTKNTQFPFLAIRRVRGLESKL